MTSFTADRALYITSYSLIRPKDVNFRSRNPMIEIILYIINILNVIIKLFIEYALAIISANDNTIFPRRKM